MLLITKRFYSWSLLSLSLLSATGRAQIKVALVGDSTVATYSSGEKQGWGSKLGAHFDAKKATVSNFAKGGAGTKSFYSSSLWKNALGSKAKFLFIQFGHNDENGMADYRKHLRLFVKEARAKGMTPILVTPLRRVRWASNGKSTSNLTEHAETMKTVAKELSVPVIDLHSMSGAQYNKWGKTKTTGYFAKGDKTHPNSKGAVIFAGLVAGKIAAAAPALGALMKGAAATSGSSPLSSYDPEKDPAYDGYKYRPGQGFSVSKHELPARPSCVREVKGTISVSGTLDGNGCLYTFKGTANGKSYKELCFAPSTPDEILPPMFDLKPGATIKNMQIECALDGIHTSSNNTIDNVFFRDVEQGAITLDKNITVKNSTFFFCNDKCIQMNEAVKARIENNKFYYATSAVLANTGRDILVKDNFFYDVEKAIHSSNSGSLVMAETNSQDGGQCHIVAHANGVLEDWGVGTVKNVASTRCVADGGKIVKK